MIFFSRMDSCYRKHHFRECHHVQHHALSISLHDNNRSWVVTCEAGLFVQCSSGFYDTVDNIQITSCFLCIQIKMTSLLEWGLNFRKHLIGRNCFEFLCILNQMGRWSALYRWSKRLAHTVLENIHCCRYLESGVYIGPERLLSVCCSFSLFCVQA